MEAPNPNRISVTLAWLVFWICVCGASSFAISQFHGKQPDHLLPKTPPSVQNDDPFSHEQTLRVRGRDAAERRSAEFAQALGGAAAAAFKNPDYSLREALHRAAIECAPTNANVLVEVDRFTEFNITISRSESFSTNEMTEMARRFLPLAKDYLDSLRFSVKGTVVAEFDRQDIEFVEDWARVSAQRLAQLLARETESAGDDPGNIERWKQQRQLSDALSAEPGASEKVTAAEKRFQAALKSAYEDLNAAIVLSRQATSLGDIAKASHVDVRLRQLDDAAARGAKARAFFADISTAWREALVAEGISGEALDGLIKGFPAIFRQDPTKAAKAFEALNGAIESSRYFLKLAGDQLGEWSFSPESGQFGFTTQEFARRFQRARDQLIRDDQELEKTLLAWNEAVIP